MQALQQIIHPSIQSIGPSEGAYGRQEIPVPPLPQVLQPTIVFEQAHSIPHARRNLPLSIMCQSIQQIGIVDTACGQGSCCGRLVAEVLDLCEDVR